MSVKHMQLGGDLGLTLEGYVNMGLAEAMKGKCIICGDYPVDRAGVCLADGTTEARQAMGTPNAKKDPYSHRLVFWAVCDSCQFDPDMDDKVRQKVLQAVERV